MRVALPRRPERHSCTVYQLSDVLPLPTTAVQHLLIDAWAQEVLGKNVNPLRPLFSAVIQGHRAAYQPLCAVDIWVHDPRESDCRLTYNPRQARLRE